jgi:hypothetical protein
MQDWIQIKTLLHHRHLWCKSFLEIIMPLKIKEMKLQMQLECKGINQISLT